MQAQKEPIIEILDKMKEIGCHHIQVVGCEHLYGPVYQVVLKFLVKAKKHD